MEQSEPREDTPKPHSGEAGRAFVFLHTAFHGNWFWERVSADLVKAGHETFTPCFEGCGNLAYRASTALSLDRYVDDLVELIGLHRLNRAIVVGHGLGGAIGLGLVDRIAERIERLVLVDGLVLSHGEAPYDRFTPERRAELHEIARRTSGGITVPPPSPAHLGVSDPDDAAFLLRHLSPQPISVQLSSLTLRRQPGYGVPVSYVICAPDFDGTAKSREYAKRQPTWQIEEIGGGFEAALFDRAALVSALKRIATAGERPKTN